MRISIFSLVFRPVLSYLSASVFAFGEKCHKRITEEAIHQVSVFLPLSKILDGCTYPDEVENGNLYSGHFYDPLFDFSRQEPDNALTRMESHYRQALEARARDDLNTAGHELGQALHYVQDMCCSVHTWGYSFNMSPQRLLMHVAYENGLDAMPSYTFPDYNPRATDIREAAVYWSKQEYNTAFAKAVREYAGKGESAFGWFRKIVYLGGFNPGCLIVSPIGTRFVISAKDKRALDIPMKASCDVLYSFCKASHTQFSLQSSRGKVVYKNE